MVTDSPNTIRVSFASISDVASAYAIHANGWVPVIDHSGRVAPYLRSEKFRKKVKPTAAAAIEYAARVLWWRQKREAEKRRHREAVDSPWWSSHHDAMLEAAE